MTGSTRTKAPVFELIGINDVQPVKEEKKVEKTDAPDEESDDPLKLRPVKMIEYKPVEGSIAASCNGDSEGNTGCNTNFSCCRPKVGEF